MTVEVADESEQEREECTPRVKWITNNNRPTFKLFVTFSLKLWRQKKAKITQRGRVLLDVDFSRSRNLYCACLRSARALIRNSTEKNLRLFIRFVFHLGGWLSFAILMSRMRHENIIMLTHDHTKLILQQVYNTFLCVSSDFFLFMLYPTVLVSSRSFALVVSSTIHRMECLGVRPTFMRCARDFFVTFISFGLFNDWHLEVCMLIYLQESDWMIRILLAENCF